VRILTVGNRYPVAGGGGHEAIWRALVGHLRDEGDEVEVLTSDEPGDPMPGVHRELPWFWADGAWLRPGPRAARAIEGQALATVARHVRRFAPDVVLWVAMGGLPLAVVGASGVPEAALVHDGWPVYGPQVDPRTRRKGWDPDPVRVWSCNSAFVRDRCLPALGPVATPRLRVDPPGIDPGRFAPAPAGDWSGRLAVIGRVEERKGAADAVRALAELPNCTLAVTGPPEAGYDRVVAALAAELGVAERCALTGAADDVRCAYVDADAILFPVTWDEPFGLVPLEAMSVGRPVVATGTGGSAEYLRDKENCLLVPAGDPSALARAVARLATDAPLRERLVACGRDTAARFTEEAWCRAIAAMLRDTAVG
jgi:glycosyltransferase involved in cell wall biosynthesis